MRQSIATLTALIAATFIIWPTSNNATVDASGAPSSGVLQHVHRRLLYMRAWSPNWADRTEIDLALLPRSVDQASARVLAGHTLVISAKDPGTVLRLVHLSSGRVR
jgi:hypothetical protein